MKHWCFYTRVVAYLEKVEALFPDKTHKGAYLLWRDDDGNPLMIAGPGVDWFQGRGPMPDLDNLGRTTARKPTNRNIRGVDGSPRSRRHSCRSTSADAPRQQARANSKRPNATNQQSRGRKAVVKTPTHRPSAKSKTPTTSAPVNRNSQERTVRVPALAARQGPTPTKQANKKPTNFVKSAQIRSYPSKEKQNPAP